MFGVSRAHLRRSSASTILETHSDPSNRFMKGDEEPKIAIPVVTPDASGNMSALTKQG